MLSSSTIEPGESGKIKTTVATKGKTGRMIRRIRVKSNDPAREQVSLLLILEVEVKPVAGTGKKSP